MSHFTNYDLTSVSYDTGRIPVGANLYLGTLLLNSRRPLAELSVVDCGCGTGNYSRALLEAGLGKINAFDASAGMLDEARKKLGAWNDNGTTLLKQHCLPTVPNEFGKDCFDAAMLNFVLHHVETEQTRGNYDITSETIKNVATLIKPNGLIFIETMSQYQLDHGMWYYALLPKRILNAMHELYIPIERLQSILEEMGFEDIQHIVPTNKIFLTPQTYSDIRGPLSSEWRQLDSVWSMISDDELDKVRDRVAEIQKTGATQYLQEREALRKVCGSMTYVIARKQN